MDLFTDDTFFKVAETSLSAVFMRGGSEEARTKNYEDLNAVAQEAERKGLFPLLQETADQHSVRITTLDPVAGEKFADYARLILMPEQTPQESEQYPLLSKLFSPSVRERIAKLSLAETARELFTRINAGSQSLDHHIAQHRELDQLIDAALAKGRGNTLKQAAEDFAAQIQTGGDVFHGKYQWFAQLIMLPDLEGSKKNQFPRLVGLFTPETRERVARLLFDRLKYIAVRMDEPFPYEFKANTHLQDQSRRDRAIKYDW